MARKGSQPALYELIRRGGPQSTSASTSSGPPNVEAQHAAPALPAASGAPSRTLRVPIGYVYGAVALLLFAIVASYMYGVSVGQQLAADLKQQQREAEARMPTVDPLEAGKVPPSIVNAEDRANDAKKASSAASDDLGPPPGTDPRRPGLNYFVLAQTTTKSAQAMASFCRKNGLDAHAIPEENKELSLVIVVPGFEKGERQSPAVQALFAKIKSVGLKWKNAAPGNRDFGDAYPSKYQPRN